MAFSKTHAWSVFKYLYNQLSLSQLFLIFFSSFLMNYSYSTFTFSLSVTILSLPLPFPPISHSRLTIAVADFVMCPFFPFCSWQILYFFIYFLSIPLNSFQGADFIWTISVPCPILFNMNASVRLLLNHQAKLLRKVAALTLYLCNLNVIAPVHISCYVL